MFRRILTQATRSIKNNNPKLLSYTAVTFTIGGLLYTSDNIPLPISYAASVPSTQVYGWGNNLFGQLGHGSSMTESFPRPIVALDSVGVKEIVADGESILAITEDGRVYVWGQEEEYCLGTGRNVSTHVPTLLRLPPIKTANLSSTHGCAIDTDGRLWVWGTRALGLSDSDFSNTYNESTQPTKYRGLFTTSTGNPRESGAKANEKVAKVPTLVDSTPWNHVPISSVSCGLNHTLFILEDGRVFGMGSNYEGALGLGKDYIPAGSEKSRLSPLRTPIQTPVEIPELRNKDISKIVCGKRYSLALSKNGEIYSFGEDSYGQLGQTSLLNSDRYLYQPTKIQDTLDRVKIVDIAAGDSHAAAISDQGHVYVWGLGSDGQIGNGARDFKNYSPVLNQTLANKNVKATKVACGGGHTAIVDAQGQLWLFGRGRDGQLGRGKQLESVAAGRTLPVCVDVVKEEIVQKPFDPKAVRIVDISLGTNSSFAVIKRF